MSSALDKLAKRATPMTGGREIEIPLGKIRFDPTQPRKAFHHLDGRVDEKDEAYIQELAQTIKVNGLIEAITVSEVGDGTYLLIVGECRTRAHLLLGKDTIRGVVRNDLTSRSKRLIYQLAENVNRKDLTDQDLAESIRELMAGVEGSEPMSQVLIAEAFGKSEGWVSRFVKFGDEELQRLWVKSGIADTVEKVYRLSILPKAAQVDILRRVDLPKRDPEWLAKPLNRTVIDELARDAKIAKRDGPKSAPPAEPGAASAQPLASAPDAGGAKNNGVASDDAVGQAFARSATQTRAQLDADDKAPATVIASGGYKLPAGAREALLGSVSTSSEGVPAHGSEKREAMQSPVNCRVSVSTLIALVDVLKSSAEMRGAVDRVQCDLNIPGPLAQLIANQLTGVIVDRKEVPAIVQMELAKLQ